MALNLNTSPYFDDFDADNNYTRLLFKPGVAVQARELTQLQSTLQHQISSLGDFTLKQGAVITGCAENLTVVPFVKINDTDNSGNSISNSTLKNLVGEQVSNLSSSNPMTATIMDVAEGLETSSTDKKALYLSYTNYGGRAATDSKIFAAGEVLTVVSPGGHAGKTFVVNSTTSSSLGAHYEGAALKVSLSPGIIFANGSFIVTSGISTFAHPFNNSTRRKIGFVVTESIVTSNTDSTLLDPASGSYNYNAPGADRLKQTVTLASYGLNEASPTNFYEYCTFEYGKIVRHKTKQDPLNHIGDFIARRHYSTHGNYVINGLLVNVREHLNDGNNGGLYTSANGGVSTKLVAEVSPGIAVVGGRQFELDNPSIVVFNKPTTYNTVNNSTFQTNYGNYVIVDEFCGAWDVDGGKQVELRSAAAGAVTAGTFSITAAPGNKVGTAKVRHIVLHSGTAGTAAAQYKVYLYDIKMMDGAFEDVRGIYYDQTDADAHADLVLESSNAVLKDPNFNKFIYSLPKTYIKTLQANSGAYDYTFSYTKEFDVSLDSGLGGDVTLTVTGDESFPFTTGTMSSSNVEAHVTVVAKDGFTSILPTDTISSGELIDMTATNRSVVVNSATSITLNVATTSVSAAADIRAYVTVQVTNEDPIAKSIQKNQYVQIDASEVGGTTFSLGVSDVLRVTEIRAHSSTFRTAGLTAGTDVTSQFRFNNGQQDNYYGHAKITKKNSATVDLSTNNYLLVKFDYFTRTTAGPTFACVDSYPVDDTGATGIYTQEIPIYSSTKSGVFDLRNCIDFRPYVTNTATPTTSAASLSDNSPGTLESISRGNGLTNPKPTETFTTDMQHYLTKACRVIMNKSGNLRVIEGIPDEKVAMPKLLDEGAMEIAKFTLKPYPSLSDASAKYYNRPDLGTRVLQVENPHYKMRDIGALEARIQNLEYYTSLNFLEKEAKEERFLDSSGVDRFKNGLMVDTFMGHAVADVSDPDFHASIDPKRRHLRAYFDTETVDFRPYFEGDDTEAGQTGKVFHVPFLEKVYTEQLQASKSEEIVTELIPRPEIIPEPPPPQIIREIIREVPGPTQVIHQHTTVVEPVHTIETIIIKECPSEPEPTVPNPAYSVLKTNDRIDEGGTVKFWVQGMFVRPNTTIGYSVSGLTAADLSAYPSGFNPTTMQGTFTFTNGDASDKKHAFTLANDETTEGAETMRLTLDASDSLGFSTGSLYAECIINDTSIPPAVPEVDPTPVCIGNYVLNSARTACVPPECGPGYRWDPGAPSGLGDGNYGACVWIPPDRQVVIGSLVLSPDSDHWHTVEWAEPKYTNKTGEADHFEYPQIADVEAWHVEWAAWESIDPKIISTTVQTFRDPIGDTDDLKFVEQTVRHVGDRGFAGLDYQELGGIYEAWKNYNVYEKEITNIQYREQRAGVATYQGEMPDAKIQYVSTDENYDTNYAVACRAQAIDFFATGLAPELEHTFSFGGGKYTVEVTTDANGTCSGSIAIADGDFKQASVQAFIEGSEDNRFRSVVSSASATWTWRGETQIKRKEYDRWMAPQPATRNIKSGIRLLEKDTIEGEKQNERTDSEYLGLRTVWMNKYEDITVESFISGEFNENEYSNDPGTARSTVVEIVDTGAVYDYTAHTIDTTSYQALSDIGGTAAAYLSGLGTTIAANSSNNYTNTAAPVAPTSTPINTNMITDVSRTASAASLERANAMKFAAMNRNPYGSDMWCGNDPMAQTFIVENMPGGMYVTSVDLFFHTKSSEANNNGITLELRTVENGYPGPDVLGRVRKRMIDINTSSSGAITTKTGTNFRFDTPVFLEEGEEYCLVPIPDRDDTDYTIWIGELGKTMHNSTKTISKQAHTGILFTSANNRTWTPRQKEDMCFRLNRAMFRTDTTYNVPMSNDHLDWHEYSNFSTGSEFTLGKVICGMTFDITNAGVGYASAPTVTITDTTGVGTGATATATYDSGTNTITAITLTAPGYGYTNDSVITVTLSGGSPSTAAEVTAQLNLGRVKYKSAKYSTQTVRIVRGYFTAGDLVGDDERTATVGTIHDRVIDSYVLKAAVSNRGSKGTIVPTIALTETGAASVGSTFSTAILDKTINLDKEYTLYSYSNEYANYLNTSVTPNRANKSLKLNFALTTPVNNLSPMLSIGDTIMPIFSNDINNDVSGEEVRTGGTATSKYISRRVTLAEGQDAEDIKVYLDSSIPNEAGVNVYYKIIHNSDDADFGEDLYWREMSVEESPKEAKVGFGEYLYKVPDKGSNSFGLNSGVIEYDVTRIKTITGGTGGTYSGTPNVIITHSGNGFGAKAEAIMSAGSVTSIVVTDPGRDYDGGTITISFSGGGETVAAAGWTATTDTVTYSGFKQYAVKIVHTSSSTAKIPLSTNLRAYALQA